jgi:fibronectin-binding autotransporter adhesin
MGRALGDIRMRRSNWTIFRCALQIAVLVALSVPMKPLLADTTLNSGTTTVSTGTNFGQGLFVATTGTATMDVVAGGYATNSYAYLGQNTSGVGTANVTSGTWANSGNLYVGNFGTGTLKVNGGNVTNAIGYISYNNGSVGTATVSSGTWANSSLVVGDSGRGTLNVTGGYVSSTAGTLGNSSDGVGTANVSSGAWANGYRLTVGSSGTGTLNVSGGSVTNTDGYLGYSVSSVGTATVSSGTWANSGILYVGWDGTGTLNVTGGRLANSIGYLGIGPGSLGTANVSSGTWANSGGLSVGDSGTGTLNVSGGSVTNTVGILGNYAGGVGTANVSSGTWANSGNLTVGSSGTGTLTMTGGLVVVGGTLSRGTYGTINVNAGGTLQIGTGTTDGVLGVSTLMNNGTLVFNRSNASTFSGIISGTGAVTKQGGGTLTLDEANTYSGLTTISAGTLQIGSGSTTGSINGNLVNNATLAFSRSDASTYSGIISGTGTIQNAGTGTTTLTGQTSYAVPLVATAGRLIVGSTASVNGFSTTGSLAAASGATLEVKSKGLAYVNGLSTLTGGTIRAANGIFLSAGPNIGVIGTGVVSGFVSATRGSRIEADGGKLVVGDSNSYIGFDSDGLLYTNANEVELLDRNLAVLGALTQLGDGSAGGTLRATNGILLEQGKNVVGRGTVYGNFVNQGDVYGDGSIAGQKIVFAAGSTVSGIGSFENVVFDGTYSPGNSPAITNLSNGEFSSASSLLIELGGTQPGTQYDRVVDSGVLNLVGGTLNVVLYNGFVPSYGNSFEILQYGQLSGDFGTVNYPALSDGLSWERTTSATAMTITVVPEPSTYAISAIATAGLASLMRWRQRRTKESDV